MPCVRFKVDRIIQEHGREGVKKSAKEERPSDEASPRRSSGTAATAAPAAGGGLAAGRSAPAAGRRRRCCRGPERCPAAARPSPAWRRGWGAAESPPAGRSGGAAAETPLQNSPATPERLATAGRCRWRRGKRAGGGRAESSDSLEKKRVGQQAWRAAEETVERSSCVKDSLAALGVRKGEEEMTRLNSAR